LIHNQFGKTALYVSKLGFGAARLGGIFQNQSRREALRLLDQSFDSGINFYDTSDMYCQGESEALIGAAFAGHRDRVIIATKVGYRLPSQRRVMARVKPLVQPLIRALRLRRQLLPAVVSGHVSQNFSPAYIRAALEGSLRRLQTDYVDLYQLHSPPPDVLEHGEFVHVLQALQREGKLRYFGVSCETPEDARLCLRYPQLSALQLRVNLFDQSILPEVLPRAREAGLAVIARECFAGGILVRPSIQTTLVRDIRDGGEGARMLGLAEWQALADQNGCTLGELALRFVSNLDGVSTVIVGLRTLPQLADTLTMMSHCEGIPTTL
jgi:aryl-alcohol dehydrogenase-like predicted oxidoreductase